MFELDLRPSCNPPKKISEFRSSQDTMHKVSTTSVKALEASYAVSLLIVKAKKPFTAPEDLLLPAGDVLPETIKLWQKCFSLQLDESTEVSGNVQCIAFVLILTTFMTRKGLIARIKDENPDMKWTHCVIHREALACKKMSPVLHDVLNDSIKVINFIKSRPRNARLFCRLCKHMGAEHRRILNRLLELGSEVHAFLIDRSPHATLFQNTDWLAKLCYLADVFSKLKELNVSLQGKDTSILNLYDKVGGFLKKAELEDVDRAPIKSVIVGHLTNLIQDFHSFFPDKSAELDWVRNPFLLSEASGSKLVEFCVCVKQEHPDLGHKALEQLLPFVSTYLCEASFSAMTVIKTKQSNRLCLEKSLITAVASLSPRLTKIISEA
uniref:Uncharacterized protein n=1 Tax=Cyclopterus lumpus TaxID=8103 RepID=A0A8C3AQM9_CYCLU